MIHLLAEGSALANFLGNVFFAATIAGWVLLVGHITGLLTIWQYKK